MKIDVIALQNFRSYKEATYIKDLSRVNAFIGPNNADKSNIVEALKLIRGFCVNGNLTKPFLEFSFDRVLSTEVQISLTLLLSVSEQEKVLEHLLKGNPEIHRDNLLQSAFLKSLGYTIEFSEKGIVNEDLLTPNFESGDYIILRKVPNPMQGDIMTAQSGELESVFNSLPNLHKLEQVFSERSGAPKQFRLLDYAKLSHSENQLVTALRKFIERWEWFEPNRYVTARMDSGEDRRLEGDGNNLTRFMNTLLSNDPRRFVKPLG